MELKGVVLKVGKPTRNGKYIFSEDIIDSCIKEYSESIETKRSLGEFGIINCSSVSLEKASHIVTSLKRKGNKVICSVKILDTPRGNLFMHMHDVTINTVHFDFRGTGSIYGDGIVQNYTFITVDIDITIYKTIFHKWYSIFKNKLKGVC